MRVSCLVLLLAGLQGALAFYGDGDVVVLTPDNFKSTLLKQPALVEFYAPWCGHCRSLTPEWQRAAQALKGLVTVAAVDADAHRELGAEYGVNSFPTIKFLYADAAGQIQAVQYSGGRSAKEMVQWGLQQVQRVALARLGVKSGGGGGGGGGGGAGGGGGRCGGGCGGGGGQEDFYSGTEVVTLSDSDFHSQVVDSEDLWFVEFYAPWCGHCKSLKPAWIELAASLKGRVRVGAVDCTAHKQTCDEFGVQGFPTLKFFGQNKEAPEEYGGNRDSGSLAQFATQRWSAQQPPPEVRELLDDHTWEEHCIGHEADPGLEVVEVKPKQLCLLAFLPHILDSKADGRQAYLQILRGLTVKYKDRPFSYLWAQGGAQSELEANFGVGGYGYPALVAFNPSKAKYASLKAAFEEAHVRSFIESVRQGFESVADVSGELARVATVDAWDGGDGEEVVEEEFDLADLMGDDESDEGAEL